MGVQNHDIHVSLSYLRDLPLYHEEVPYEIWFEELDPAIKKTNIQLEITKNVPITDVRSLGSQGPRLESHGFEYFDQAWPEYCGIRTVDDVGDKNEEQRGAIAKYLECMTQVLQQRYNGRKVICYDWRVRRAEAGIQPEAPNIYNLNDFDGEDLRGAKINAAHIIHADAAPNWMKRLLSELLTDEEKVEVLKHKHRVRIVNLWRPISPVVNIEPLALCDVRTVHDSDWDIVEKVLEHSVEESMYLKRNDNHKWYWMSDQTRGDVLAITIWDSLRSSSPSASTPHCAIGLPGRSEQDKPRESIEMRFVLITDS